MKKLRKKIVLGVFMSALVVFVLTILLVYISLNTQVTYRADSMTKLIVQNNGVPPIKSEFEKMDDELGIRIADYNEESPYRLRFFTVSYDDNGYARCDISHIAKIDEVSAVLMADSVRSEFDKTGSYENFRYRVNEDGSMVVFVDYSEEYSAIDWLTVLLALIALGFIIMITVVFYFLSKRIVKPFEENSRMQKQFITDASHELKTPLAIISANAEVLAYKTGENEWIDNITAQVDRVSGLVNELLTLNRLEEVEEITDTEPVDMSALVTDTASSFDEVFRSKSVERIDEIEPDVILNGNKPQLERLISVLVENASKYVDENGKVHLELSKDLRYTTFRIFNSCEIDQDVDYSHLFDRFYRPDSSRTSSTGGHGIGLSIAKRIVTLHNGTIEAIPSDDGLSISVKLSNKIKASKQKKVN
ncbi:MAG: HAMP domain-containing histidine kinase [Ruminococcus sp.]|uniref:sensor histidine kinase n=1 Tax=Ruminococcus sp. TaxID=41978 RepID=UPI002872EE35|nr:HAMP domain-containing sensor histidine kinase [Ruminococcus sp.]MBQ3285553.1 HAMP domain-containing histidine kinase [Ruminococcus sp.]